MSDVMTVADLIKALSEHDPTLPVYVRGYESGIDDIVEVRPVRVYRHVNRETYYGQHEDAAGAVSETPSTPGLRLLGTNDEA